MVFTQTSPSTLLEKQSTLQLFMAHSNYPASALPIAAHFAEQFKTIHFLTFVQRTLQSSALSNEQQYFLTSLSLFLSVWQGKANRVNTWQNAFVWALIKRPLGNEYEKSRPAFQQWCVSTCGSGLWGYWNANGPMIVPLRLRARLSAWKHLMSAVSITRICSSGSIRLTTLRFGSLIETVPIAYHSLDPYIHMGSTKCKKNSPLHLTILQTVPNRVKVLCRLPLAFSMKLHLLFCGIKSIDFKHCVTFRSGMTSLGARVFG